MYWYWLGPMVTVRLNSCCKYHCGWTGYGKLFQYEAVCGTYSRASQVNGIKGVVAGGRTRMIAGGAYGLFTL